MLMALGEMNAFVFIFSQQTDTFGGLNLRAWGWVNQHKLFLYLILLI